MKRYKLIISWVLRVLVALGFIAASLGKLSQNSMVIEMFENWGFPDNFYLIIGILELALAILLLIPKTLKIALIGLTMILIGALITHALKDPMTEMLRPIIFLVLLTVVYVINYRKKNIGDVN